MSKLFVFGLVVLSLTLFACQPKGGGEKAGERADEVIDNIKDGEAPLKEKGAMEKTGEFFDDSKLSSS